MSPYGVTRLQCVYTFRPKKMVTTLQITYQFLKGNIRILIQISLKSFLYDSIGNKSFLGNGLASNRPLLKPITTKISDAIWRHWATTSLIKKKYQKHQSVYTYKDVLFIHTGIKLFAKYYQKFSRKIRMSYLFTQEIDCLHVKELCHNNFRSVYGPNSPAMHQEFYSNICKLWWSK